MRTLSGRRSGSAGVTKSADGVRPQGVGGQVLLVHLLGEAGPGESNPPWPLGDQNEAGRECMSLNPVKAAPTAVVVSLPFQLQGLVDELVAVAVRVSGEARH